MATETQKRFVILGDLGPSRPTLRQSRIFAFFGRDGVVGLSVDGVGGV